MSSLSLAEEQLQLLHDYVKSLGGQLKGTWKCRAQVRESGARKGSIDTWFTAPDGEIHRSKVAAARSLGLDPSMARKEKPKASSKPKNKNGTNQKKDEKWIWEATASSRAPNLDEKEVATLLMTMPVSVDMDDCYDGPLYYKDAAHRGEAGPMAQNRDINTNPACPIETPDRPPWFRNTGNFEDGMAVAHFGDGIDCMEKSADMQQQEKELPPDIPVAQPELTVEAPKDEVPAQDMNPWATELEVIRKCFVKLPLRQIDREPEDEPAPLSPKSRQAVFTEALLGLSDCDMSPPPEDLEPELWNRRTRSARREKTPPSPGADADWPAAPWSLKRFPIDQLTANGGTPTCLHPTTLFFLRYREELEARARRKAQRTGKGGKKSSKASKSDGAGQREAKVNQQPSNAALRGKSVDQLEAALLERLSQYISDLGGQLPQGWTAKASVRVNGANAGGIDAYYYDPAGKRHKSMVKVAAALGLEADSSIKPKPLVAVLDSLSVKSGSTSKGATKSGRSRGRRTCGVCRYCLNPQLKKACLANKGKSGVRKEKRQRERSPSEETTTPQRFTARQLSMLKRQRGDATPTEELPPTLGEAAGKHFELDTPEENLAREGGEEEHKSPKLDDCTTVLRLRGGGTSCKNRKIRSNKSRKKQDDKVTCNYDKVLKRLRGQLGRLRQEQALIEAYAADGWRGASKDKVKPVAEINRAKQQIERCKTIIRECVKYCDEAEGDVAIPAELFDSEGELDNEHIFCAKCEGKECTDENDIIMCDGSCNRAYHFKCLAPPLDACALAALPEDEGWLCPACDKKMDMIDYINDEFGTDYPDDVYWDDVLKPGAPLPICASIADPGSPRTAPVDLKRLETLLATADLPSEDEEDEDYEASESDSDISERNALGNTPMELDSDSDSEASSLVSEALSGDISDVKIPTDFEEPAVTVNGKRRRPHVDYKALHQEMFGDEVKLVLDKGADELEDDDDVWSPTVLAARIKKRSSESDSSSSATSSSTDDESETSSDGSG